MKKLLDRVIKFLFYRHYFYCMSLQIEEKHVIIDGVYGIPVWKEFDITTLKVLMYLEVMKKLEILLPEKKDIIPIVRKICIIKCLCKV